MKKLTCFTLALVACARPHAGTHRVAYPGGNPHFEYDTVDGVPNGRGRVWYPSGELRSEGPYVDGVKHGEFTFYTEDGALDYRAIFVNDQEVWRASDARAVPPRDLVARVEAAPRTKDEGLQLLRFSTRPPAPYFGMLDRTTSLDRAGLAIGFGEAHAIRSELFANHQFSSFGIYGQFSQTEAKSELDMTVSGRRTLEAGATYLASDMISLRAGLLVPIGNDDTGGFVASSLGAFQRPTDAATSVPSTVAVRTGTSVLKRWSYLVAQADAGVDWLFGGQRSFDALLRVNAGVGAGVRSLLFTVELSNAIRASDPAQRIDAIGIATTYWVDRIWLAAVVSTTFDGHRSVTGALGYEL